MVDSLGKKIEELTVLSDAAECVTVVDTWLECFTLLDTIDIASIGDCTFLNYCQTLKCLSSKFCLKYLEQLDFSNASVRKIVYLMCSILLSVAPQSSSANTLVTMTDIQFISALCATLHQMASSTVTHYVNKITELHPRTNCEIPQELLCAFSMVTECLISYKEDLLLRLKTISNHLVQEIRIANHPVTNENYINQNIICSDNDSIIMDDNLVVKHRTKENQYDSEDIYSTYHLIKMITQNEFQLTLQLLDEIIKLGHTYCQNFIILLKTYRKDLKEYAPCLFDSIYLLGYKLATCLIIPKKLYSHSKSVITQCIPNKSHDTFDDFVHNDKHDVQLTSYRTLTTLFESSLCYLLLSSQDRHKTFFKEWESIILSVSNELYMIYSQCFIQTLTKELNGKLTMSCNNQMMNLLSDTTSDIKNIFLLRESIPFTHIQLNAIEDDIIIFCQLFEFILLLYSKQIQTHETEISMSDSNDDVFHMLYTQCLDSLIYFPIRNQNLQHLCNKSYFCLCIGLLDRISIFLKHQNIYSDNNDNKNNAILFNLYAYPQLSHLIKELQCIFTVSPDWLNTMSFMHDCDIHHFVDSLAYMIALAWDNVACQMVSTFTELELSIISWYLQLSFSWCPSLSLNENDKTLYPVSLCVRSWKLLGEYLKLTDGYDIFILKIIETGCSIQDSLLTSDNNTQTDSCVFSSLQTYPSLAQKYMIHICLASFIQTNERYDQLLYTIGLDLLDGLQLIFRRILMDYIQTHTRISQQHLPYSHAFLHDESAPNTMSILKKQFCVSVHHIIEGCLFIFSSLEHHDVSQILFSSLMTLLTVGFECLNYYKKITLTKTKETPYIFKQNNEIALILIMCSMIDIYTQTTSLVLIPSMTLLKQIFLFFNYYLYKQKQSILFHTMSLTLPRVVLTSYRFQERIKLLLQTQCSSQSFYCIEYSWRRILRQNMMLVNKMLQLTNNSSCCESFQNAFITGCVLSMRPVRQIINASTNHLTDNISHILHDVLVVTQSLLRVECGAMTHQNTTPVENVQMIESLLFRTHWIKQLFLWKLYDLITDSKRSCPYWCNLILKE